MSVALFRRSELERGLDVSGTSQSRAERQLELAQRFRLLIRSRRERLDRELADGLPSDGSPARAMRARQLNGASTRRTIAALLVNVLDAARECSDERGSPLIVNDVAVSAARPEIVGLIERLRSSAELEPRGLALARLLVCDPASPIFRSTAAPLTAALAEITAAL